MRIVFSYFFYVSLQKKNALRIISWQTTFKIRTSTEEWQRRRQQQQVNKNKTVK